MSNTFLDKIVIAKQKEVKTLYKKYGLDELKQSANSFQKTPRRFYNSLASDGLSLIAEVKKASPSKGIIRKEFDHVKIAKEFSQNNASAISILTEKEFFLGSPDYLADIKRQVSLALLRKDFIIDPIQIWESKFMGADAILLIKALLDNSKCQDLLDLCEDAGLDALVEVHNEEELNDVLTLKHINMIGINNRDLHSFDVDTNTARILNKKIKSHCADKNKKILVIAESGYDNKNDLTTLEKEAFDAVLIGEGLAKNTDLINYFGKKV